MRTSMIWLALLACSGTEPAAPSKQAPAQAVVAAPKPPAPLADSELDGWYHTLADDHAEPSAWISAAQNLADHPDLDHPAAVRGESLRTHAAPSVTDLLQRRITAPNVDIDGACSLADALLQWDRAVGLPIAAREMRRAIAGSHEWPNNQAHNLGIAALALHRADAGDMAAIDEYAAWLATIAPSESGWGDSDSFVPMALFADRPSIAKASEALFGARSVWIPIVSPKPRVPEHQNPEFLLDPSTMGKTGGFIAASGLNRHVVAALADKRVVGTLVVAAGELDIEYSNGDTATASHIDDPAIAKGTKRTIRVCDYYAARLAEHDGAPTFDLAWPDARRDQTLPAIATWVKAQAGKPAKRAIAD